MGRRHFASDAEAIAVEDTPTQSKPRWRQPLRNGPWQFTPDHTFQSVHHLSAIARFQLQISEMAERGNFISCLKICKDMKEQGIKPTLLVYNGLLQAAAKNSLYTEAEGILDDMGATGVKPDAQSYHHLIKVGDCCYSHLYTF